MKRLRSTDFQARVVFSRFSFGLHSDPPLCALPLTLLFDSRLVQSRSTMNRLLAIAVRICRILACRCIHYVRAGHVGLVQGAVQVAPQHGSIWVGHFNCTP